MNLFSDMHWTGIWNDREGLYVKLMAFVMYVWMCTNISVWKEASYMRRHWQQDVRAFVFRDKTAVHALLTKTSDLYSAMCTSHPACRLLRHPVETERQTPEKVRTPLRGHSQEFISESGLWKPHQGSIFVFLWKEMHFYATQSPFWLDKYIMWPTASNVWLLIIVALIGLWCGNPSQGMVQKWMQVGWGLLLLHYCLQGFYSFTVATRSVSSSFTPPPLFFIPASCLYQIHVGHAGTAVLISLDGRELIRFVVCLALDWCATCR